LKRVEVFASSEKAAEVLAAIKDKGFEATLYDSKGYGEQKDRVRSGRGTSEAQLAYSTRRTIVTIVDSDKLEDVVNTVKSSIEAEL
jgi:nitrogen regulatory protein PII